MHQESDEELAKRLQEEEESIANDTLIATYLEVRKKIKICYRLQLFSKISSVPYTRRHYDKVVYSTNAVKTRLRLGFHCLYKTLEHYSVIKLISSRPKNHCYNEIPVYLFINRRDN